MTTLLTTLATKLAEKWMALVVLPGLLLVATVCTGRLLGHEHALDAGHLVDEVGRIGAAAGDAPAATLAVALVALLLASVAAGLLAQAAGAALRWSWTVDPRTSGRFASLTARRRDRWHELDARYAAARDAEEAARSDVDVARAEGAAVRAAAGQRLSRAEAAAAAAAARRNRIALAAPSRPTWMGDRLAAAEVRVRNQYGLDLAAVWPRLQLVVPDAARADLRSAADAWNSAGVLAGWGVLYLPVTAMWWPAAPIGVAVVLVGWRRGRAAVAALADLAESAVDLHAATLATQLGMSPPPGAITPALGRQITEQLRKGT
ncbi:hypothetical protein [Actinophytocola sp. KF-1]